MAHPPAAVHHWSPAHTDPGIGAPAPWPGPIMGSDPARHDPCENLEGVRALPGPAHGVWRTCAARITHERPTDRSGRWRPHRAVPVAADASVHGHGLCVPSRGRVEVSRVPCVWGVPFQGRPTIRAHRSPSRRIRQAPSGECGLRLRACFLGAFQGASTVNTGTPTESVPGAGARSRTAHGW